MAKIDQVTTVDRSRLTRWLGHVSDADMAQIETMLRQYLELEDKT